MIGTVAEFMRLFDERASLMGPSKEYLEVSQMLSSMKLVSGKRERDAIMRRFEEGLAAAKAARDANSVRITEIEDTLDAMGDSLTHADFNGIGGERSEVDFARVPHSWYSTQTNPGKYARALAALKAKVLDRFKVPYRLEEVEGALIVFANLSREERAILGWTRNGFLIKDIVRFLWGQGVNPRVIYPSIPQGFEEANGLDYFGGLKE